VESIVDWNTTHEDFVESVGFERSPESCQIDRFSGPEFHGQDRSSAMHNECCATNAGLSKRYAFRLKRVLHLWAGGHACFASTKKP